MSRPVRLERCDVEKMDVAVVREECRRAVYHLAGEAKLALANTAAADDQSVKHGAAGLVLALLRYCHLIKQETQDYYSTGKASAQILTFDITAHEYIGKIRGRVEVK